MSTEGRQKHRCFYDTLMCAIKTKVGLCFQEQGRMLPIKHERANQPPHRHEITEETQGLTAIFHYLWKGVRHQPVPITKNRQENGYSGRHESLRKHVVGRNLSIHPPPSTRSTGRLRGGRGAKDRSGECSSSAWTQCPATSVVLSCKETSAVSHFRAQNKLRT